MSRRDRRKPTCLICLGRVGDSPHLYHHHRCVQCRQVCHGDCFRAWRRTRDDLDFRLTELETNRSACPLCNVPKPYEDRFCPGCGIAFVRIGGCDRMECAMCHHQFDFREAPRQQPVYPIYSPLELWWWGYGRGRPQRQRNPLRWCIYILVGVLVGLIANLLLLKIETSGSATDRIVFSVVFGGLAATQLMIHGEAIPNPDISFACYSGLLAICAGSLVFKIFVGVGVATTSLLGS